MPHHAMSRSAARSAQDRSRTKTMPRRSSAQPLTALMLLILIVAASILVGSHFAVSIRLQQDNPHRGWLGAGGIEQDTSSARGSSMRADSSLLASAGMPGEAKEDRLGTYYHEKATAGAGMAACLLWKDDNHNLIEWLAFHYHSMPMRRLIFHPDPRAKTSPMEILERYTSRGMLEVDVWNATFVLGRQDMNEEAWEKLDDAEKTARFFSRQNEFMRKCFLQLHSEGKWTWVTTHDIDEYLIPNMQAKNDAAVPITQAGLNARTSSHGTAKSATTPSLERVTMMELLNRAKQSSSSAMLSGPCIPFRRLTFGARETRVDTVWSNKSTFEDGIATHWKRSDFATYRWNWHIPPKKNGMGKAIVDISRVRPDTDLKANTEAPCNPHRPIKSICSAQQAWIDDASSPLVVHHYLGSKEQYLYRDDPRANLKVARTSQMFDEIAQKSKMHDSGARGWVSGFVNSVGMATAEALLVGVGDAHESE